jgi:hypothetical protein
MQENFGDWIYFSLDRTAPNTTIKYKGLLYDGSLSTWEQEKTFTLQCEDNTIFTYAQEDVWDPNIGVLNLKYCFSTSSEYDEDTCTYNGLPYFTENFAERGQEQRIATTNSYDLQVKFNEIGRQEQYLFVSCEDAGVGVEEWKGIEMKIRNLSFEVDVVRVCFINETGQRECLGTPEK